MKVKVFPDHMSSGLWDENGANMDESQVAHVLDELDFICLKYWHEVWEFFIATDEEEFVTRASGSYIERWQQDGQKMVDRWNTKQQEVEFIYVR